MKYHIVYGFDRNYAQHFGASATSLLMNFDGRAEDLCIHVISADVDPALRQRIEQLERRFGAKFVIHHLTEQDATTLDQVHHINEISHYLSPATIIRILLPQLLDDSIERVLYIDADTVVLSGLRELLEMDMQGKSVAAVSDFTAEEFARHWAIDAYFNSGVMLVDLKRWRALGLMERCLGNVATMRDRLLFVDQCLINVTLAGDILPLPEKWNTFVLADGRGGRVDEAVIAHFITADKPWQAWYRNPAGALYWKYLKASPWKGARPVAPTNVKQARQAAQLQFRQGRYLSAFRMYWLWRKFVWGLA